MVRLRLLAPALLAALAVSACGTTGPAQSQPGRAPAQTPAAATPSAGATASAGSPPSAAPAVPERLAFTAKTVEGPDFDAASLAGKPVVLWFWAPWCPKCRAAGPAVAKAAQAHQGKVSVLGVAGLSDDVGSMRDFVKATRSTTMTHLADAAVWKRFGVSAQHTFVLIGADGKVSYQGALSSDDVASRIAALAG